MKFCTSYYQSESIRTKVDELRFSISSLNYALEYSERHPEKKVIVEILDLHKEHTPSIEKLFQLQTENLYIYYDFYSLSDLVEYCQTLDKKPNHIMFHTPVATWGLVQILLYYHVSDITIGEPLIFNVNELQKNIHSQGVTIRIRPDKARTGIETTLVEESGINHFWLLPQHISLYENYVDVIDLIDNSVTRESELVNIYTRNQPYSAMIDTLILGLNCPIGADFFDDKFAVRRLTCGQTCIKNKNNCHFCDQYAKMYDVIAAQRKSSN